MPIPFLRVSTSDRLFSVSTRVEYETYKFFLDRGRQMGTY